MENITAIPLPEFEQEMATTRRLLERVPYEKGTWKPHTKSFSLGHLAQLVAWIPGWITTTLKKDEIDLAQGESYSYQTTEALLEVFDKNVTEAKAALTTITGNALLTTWFLKNGVQILYSSPRGEAVRGHLNHLIHHRGQLTVYIRLIDIPVPSIYGPTADEQW